MLKPADDEIQSCVYLRNERRGKGFGVNYVENQVFLTSSLWIMSQQDGFNVTSR